jgi:hypothetical protein
MTVTTRSVRPSPARRAPDGMPETGIGAGHRPGASAGGSVLNP